MNNVKGHIVDVVRHEIFDGELIIKDEQIVEVKRCQLPANVNPCRTSCQVSSTATYISRAA